MDNHATSLGRDAKWRGMPASLCPFPAHTEQAYAWAAGWRQADETIGELTALGEAMECGYAWACLPH